MTDMHAAVTRAPEGRSIVTRRIAGETIIVPLAEGVGDLDAIYTLNEVGSFVWSLIDGRRSTEDLVRAVCAEYDVDAARAAADVEELLTALETKALVGRSAPGSAT